MERKWDWPHIAKCFGSKKKSSKEVATALPGDQLKHKGAIPPEECCGGSLGSGLISDGQTSDLLLQVVLHSPVQTIPHNPVASPCKILLQAAASVWGGQNCALLIEYSVNQIDGKRVYILDRAHLLLLAGGQIRTWRA